jgi:hypothetical protein
VLIFVLDASCGCLKLVARVNFILKLLTIQVIHFYLSLSPLTAEIVMFDGHIVVYKFIQDLHFYVTGGDEENELILASILQGFTDAVDHILRLGSIFFSIVTILCLLIGYFFLLYLLGFRNNVDKRTALENLDLILLCLDEIIDGG